MSEHIDDDVSLSQLDDGHGLWGQLAQASAAAPGANLRQRVLNDLHTHRLDKPRWWQALMPAHSMQWIGVGAATVLGIAVGFLASGNNAGLDQRMVQMETQLDAVNQQLLMSRLAAAAPSERLAAALQAAMLDQRDPQVAAALLQRAALDTVPSVRSAAIGALGAEINQDHTAAQLLEMLSHNDSPIVQMAIVDLILRHGDTALLTTLKKHVGQNDMHPALAGYVRDTMGALDI